MDDLETKLRAARLHEPPDHFDAAMKRLLATAPRRRPSLWRAHIALWQCAAACAVCLGFGFLLHAYLEPAQPNPEPTRTVYMIPVDSELQGIFETARKPPARAQEAPRYEVRVVPAQETAINGPNRSL